MKGPWTTISVKKQREIADKFVKKIMKGEQDMEKIEELKPCPFCGGDAEGKIIDLNDNVIKTEIKCRHCDVKIRKIYHDNFHSRRTFDCVTHALTLTIYDWNKRSDN